MYGLEEFAMAGQNDNLDTREIPVSNSTGVTGDDAVTGFLRDYVYPTGNSLIHGITNVASTLTHELVQQAVLPALSFMEGNAPADNLNGLSLRQEGALRTLWRNGEQNRTINPENVLQFLNSPQTSGISADNLIRIIDTANSQPSLSGLSTDGLGDITMRDPVLRGESIRFVQRQNGRWERASDTENATRTALLDVRRAANEAFYVPPGTPMRNDFPNPNPQSVESMRLALQRMLTPSGLGQSLSIQEQVGRLTELGRQLGENYNLQFVGTRDPGIHRIGLTITPPLGRGGPSTPYQLDFGVVGLGSSGQDPSVITGRGGYTMAGNRITR
jgi:hypothetical protein